MKSNSPPVFVYGTLCSPQVVETLLGRSVASEFPAARIDNYSRHPMNDFVFPGMIPSPNQQVHGFLLENLSPTDFSILDWFEGEEYDRQLVKVCANPLTAEAHEELFIDAHTYIWKPHLLDHLILDKEWSFESFCRENLDWYLENTVRPCRLDMERLGITK